MFLYSVSTGHNTFTERSENEFSTQLLYAQKENFNRQDVIIPGMINVIEKGISEKVVLIEREMTVEKENKKQI